MDAKSRQLSKIAIMLLILVAVFDVLFFAFSITSSGEYFFIGSDFLKICVEIAEIVVFFVFAESINHGKNQQYIYIIGICLFFLKFIINGLNILNSLGLYSHSRSILLLSTFEFISILIIATGVITESICNLKKRYITTVGLAIYACFDAIIFILKIIDIEYLSSDITEYIILQSLEMFVSFGCTVAIIILSQCYKKKIKLQDIERQLIGLKTDFDCGIISEKEYKITKRRILQQMKDVK